MIVKHFFRSDPTNAGDWWSLPARYFPLRNDGVHDILSNEKCEQFSGIAVLGGGGIGRPFFDKHIKQLLRQDRDFKVIIWGVGEDCFEDRNSVISDSGSYFTGIFDSADLIGSRVACERSGYRYAPCASCMHHLFFPGRERKPTKKIGLYSHKRVVINHELLGISREDCFDNSGDDIARKLEFLSQYEFIVTNTYHGVFWATLLGRKVICFPFKSGLYSFLDRPTYAQAVKLDSELLDAAISYPDSLERARAASVAFYAEVAALFNI